MIIKILLLLVVLVVAAFSENNDTAPAINNAIESIADIEKREEDKRIGELAVRQLELIKKSLRMIDSLGYDENALKYFNAGYFLNKFQQHKKRIKSIKIATKNEWAELSRIDDDISQIIPLLYSYRLVTALKNREIPNVTIDSINTLTVVRRTRIENGDTLFNNNAELFYAFYWIAGEADNYEDSLLFRGKFKKNHLLYICLAHLNAENAKEVFKSQRLRCFADMDENELKISMKWDIYFKRVTESVLNNIIYEYTQCKFKEEYNNDTVCIAAFYKRYPKKNIAFLVKQFNKYHKCLDVLNEYKCKTIKDMLNE